MPQRKGSPMNIIDRTKAYETWLKSRIGLVPADIGLKHRAMAKAAFPFLRATFYRWVDLWRQACPDLAHGPEVLAVGDLHLENFGTWRDLEGRIVWGVNDFDEAYPMPYAIDLVRLAASAIIAVRENHLSIDPTSACSAILEGYAQGIGNGGQPFVLEEKYGALRAMALSEDRDPIQFWNKLTSFDAAAAPPGVRRLLRNQLPARDKRFRILHRVSGLGSLGRQRFVALAPWQGGLVAREAKALAPSAYAWATGKRTTRIFYMTLIERAVRCADPFVTVEQGWLLRRLGPHCARIELSDLPKKADEKYLLRAMGRETANIHLGTPEAIHAIRADLKKRKKRWLFDAAEKMTAATLADWKEWRGR
jgi:uncharacterized protein (DUF2252 family)